MKRIIILAVVLAGVWLGVYLTSWQEEEQADGAAVDWLELNASKVRSVEVNATAGGYSLRKDSGEWFVDMELGTRLRGKAKAIEGLPQFVTDTAPKRRLGAAENLAQFGLDKPQISISFAGAGDWSPAALQLGEDNPSGDGVYGQASWGQGELLLLDAAYRDTLDKPANHYVDMRLTGLSARDIVKVRLETEGGGWEIRRLDAGYEFTWPEKLVDKPVAAAEADLYVHTLTGAEAVSLPAGDIPADAAEWAAISLWAKGEAEPQRITLHKDGEKLWGRSSWQPVTFALASRGADDLRVDAFSLRDRKVVKLELGAVESATVKAPGMAEPVALRKTGAGWKAGERELPGMDMLLWQLTSLEYEAEPLPAVPESAELTAEWTLRGADGGQIAGLRFYEDPAMQFGLALVQNLPDEKAYPVSSQLAGDLLQELEPEETL